LVKRLLVEVQGGGETSSTGSITSHIQAWEKLHKPSNDYLAQPISGPGTITNNAWKRSLYQITTKATSAVNTGYGFAILYGAFLFRYIKQRLPNLDKIRLDQTNDWNTAIVVFQEAKSANGTIIFSIDLEATVFTTANDLITEFRSIGKSDPKAFGGIYRNLLGEEFNF